MSIVGKAMAKWVSFVGKSDGCAPQITTFPDLDHSVGFGLKTKYLKENLSILWKKAQLLLYAFRVFF